MVWGDDDSSQDYRAIHNYPWDRRVGGCYGSWYNRARHHLDCRRCRYGGRAVFGPEKVSMVVTVPATLYMMYNATTGAEAVLYLFCSIPLFGAVMSLASLDH